MAVPDTSSCHDPHHCLSLFIKRHYCALHSNSCASACTVRDCGDADIPDFGSLLASERPKGALAQRRSDAYNEMRRFATTTVRETMLRSAELVPSSRRSGIALL